MLPLRILIFLLMSGLLGFSQVSFNVDSIGRWRDSNLPLTGGNNTYNEIWGFSKNSREYGVIGSRQGTYIVDVTDPESPALVKFIAGTYNNATNRDYHDYNGYLYMVCDQGPSTLQIVDLKYLPDSVHLVYDSDTLFTNCHNIFIDSATAHLYACDVKDDQSKDIDLEIYDLNSSHIPSLLKSYDSPTVDAFHDIFVKNDTALGNNGNTGFFIYDFTDMQKVKILGSLPDYPDKGFNHSGYPSTDGKYYYMADETKGKDLKVVDISDLSSPSVVGVFNAGQNKTKIVAHNQLVKDTLLFVAYYHEGLQVYNIANESKPEKVGHYQTYTTTYVDFDGVKQKNYDNYPGVWGVYPYLPSGNILVSDREKGMFIFKLGDQLGLEPPIIPTEPVRLLYPNPVEDYVDLIYPADKILKISLIDAGGRVVFENLNFSAYYGNTRIIIADKLESGVYVLNVEAAPHSFAVKMVKE